MSDVVIRVENLGKMYRIGAAKQTGGLRHALEDGLHRLGQRLRGRADPRPPTEDFWALQDIAFEVKRGECVGIIGRNGAGKSTLLKILSRITEPTTGEIRMKGRVGSLLEVGTGFHPELTGRENVFLNGAILGMGRKEIARKFDEIVAFAEVEKFLDTPVKYYSSGMYTRLAFAVAAHLEPEILIVDEVLAVGDAEFQKKCLGKMGEVTHAGRTVLFVSHNMQAVSSLCNKGVLLKQGRIVAQGGVADVLAEYTRIVDATAAYSWTGDAGDADVRLLATSVTTTDPEGMYRTDAALKIRMTARIERPILGLICAVEIFNRHNARLLYSNFDDHLPPPADVVAAGCYTWELTVPANTFAAGLYHIGFDLGIHNVRRIVDGPGALAVQLENVAGVGRRYLAHTDVVRPKWEWGYCDE